ncbi:sarcosine oxidase subunit alpha family protein [Leptospira interrogans]
MSQAFRNVSGGLIDRSNPVSFKFNEVEYHGFLGDTLASAMLANGVRVVGRSFKYHRPRGVFGLGAEEPNALVQLGTGARTEPNSKATQIELYDGLVAASQNCWPSVSADVGSITGLLSRLLPAGFYYKTFKWPSGGWKVYEPFIRQMAGMGRCATEPDPDRYDHSHAHCDVLVVGAGPAGLAAAVAAGRAGSRVLLIDENERFGGALLAADETVNGGSGRAWAAQAEAELRTMADVRLLTRATAFGYYDHNQIGIVERVTDHRRPRPGEVRQRLWHVHSKRIVLATGAHERPIVFGNNDLPGVMLASAASGYLSRYAVRAGSAAVVFTNNDSAYAAAFEIAAGGVVVRAILDVRQSPPPELIRQARENGIKVLSSAAVLRAKGWRQVSGVAFSRLDANGKPVGAPGSIDCDLLCVSGGWNPAVHLHAQSRGKPVFDPRIAAFVPGSSVQAETSAGAARGLFSADACIVDGTVAGAAAAAGQAPDRRAEFDMEITPTWTAPETGRYKRFVDLQNDVTDKDIALAVREGYQSVEHVKRYTTLGMGTDQGKTSNTLGFAHIANALGIDIPSVGTTTFRPPYVPVTLGALAGAEGGRFFLPNRRSAMHEHHVAVGAVMLQAGPWLRPQCYPRAGESLDDAVRREAFAVRQNVGVVDVSTLGKFELIGPDAAAFLELIYVNRWRNLAVGRSRYGVMLREDGIAFDDGTTTRLGEHRYFMTTTTAQASLTARRLAYYHKVLWPQLDLRIIDVTEQWAAVAVAGPNSRSVVASTLEDVDVAPTALKYQGYAEGRFAGKPARIFRISFSGDLAYEIYVPADMGPALWRSLLQSSAGATPYGVDAMNTLRIEKGHVAGNELNGRVTPDDLGLGRMIRRDGDFIGRRSLGRPGLNDPSRLQLVGIVATDEDLPLPFGAKLVDETSDRYLGEITSVTWSPMLQRSIGLALLSGGRMRHGQQLYAASPLHDARIAVIVRDPHFFDPEGDRLHA